MSFSSRELQRNLPSGATSPRAARRGKGKYKSDTIWIRLKDGKEFVLKERDEIGLVFRGLDGHFLESMFRPK